MITDPHFLWVEKHRPQTVADCILPRSLSQLFTSIVREGQIPHAILSGKPGTGKTTVARAVCDEIGTDVLFVNASNEGNLDTLRTKIQQFASTVSFHDTSKVVILDEADHLTHHVQPALRSFLETFSKNCRFILTCNYIDRIIEPLRSRCTTVEFVFPKKERSAIASRFFTRVCEILDMEGVEYDQKTVRLVVRDRFPDFRKTINILQQYALTSGNRIDTGLLSSSVFDKNQMQALVELLKEKNFSGMRKWVASNIHDAGEPQKVFRILYEGLDKWFDDGDSSSRPQAILILADYQHKAAHVADQEINLVAALTEIMANCKLKKEDI